MKRVMRILLAFFCSTRSRCFPFFLLCKDKERGTDTGRSYKAFWDLLPVLQHWCFVSFEDCVASFWGIGSLNFNFAALQLVNSVFFLTNCLWLSFSPHSGICQPDCRKNTVPIVLCLFYMLTIGNLSFSHKFAMTFSSRGYFKRITTISSQFKLPMCQGYLIISSRWKNAVCRLRIARVLLQAVVRDAILWWISRRWNHCV